MDVVEALGADFEDVVYPFGIGVEDGLGYYVEIFERGLWFGVIGHGGRGYECEQ